MKIHLTQNKFVFSGVDKDLFKTEKTMFVLE